MINVKPPDPFCEAVLGEFKPDKVKTDKGTLAFARKGELFIAEEYAQKWVDPVTFQNKWIFGNVNLVEWRLVSKLDGSVSYERQMEPCLKGGKLKDML
jgi:hypothetical protein